MCILIIRSWSACGHMRATSTDKCHSCLATPGMMEYDCPNATTHYPDIEPDWPCPVCHARRRTEFGNLLQPNEQARETLWEIEQAANHSNTSLFASDTSFGLAATDQHASLPGTELIIPPLQHQIRSNAPSPSPHGSISAASRVGAANSDSSIAIRSRGTHSSAQEASLTADATNNDSTVSLSSDGTRTTSSSGGITIPHPPTTTSNSPISLTSSTATLSPVPSPAPHLPSDLFSIGEDSTYTGYQNTSRAPTVYSEAMESGVPQDLYEWAVQDEAMLAENGRLSLGHVVLASSGNSDQPSRGRAPDLLELEARLKARLEEAMRE